MKSAIMILCIIVSSLVPAWADPLIIFDVGNSGTISYAGGASSLFGTSISIPTLIASGDPQNNGSYALQDGLLSFQTGAFSSYDSSRQLLTFGPDGNITITGTVIGPGGHPITEPGALLLGSFLGATFDLTSNRFSFFLGNGPDVKSPSLVSYFFGSLEPTWEFDAQLYGLNDVRSDYHSTGTFSTPVVDHFTTGHTTFYSQVVNVDAPAEAPEPGSVFLLGSALIAISGALKRLRKIRGE